MLIVLILVLIILSFILIGISDNNVLLFPVGLMLFVIAIRFIGIWLFSWIYKLPRYRGNTSRGNNSGGLRGCVF